MKRLILILSLVFTLNTYAKTFFDCYDMKAPTPRTPLMTLIFDDSFTSANAVIDDKYADRSGFITNIPVKTVDRAILVDFYGANYKRNIALVRPYNSTKKFIMVDELGESMKACFINMVIYYRP